ncbi:hypothetical protein [Streptomyces sp. NPDC020298]|uniref:hypothetical protein n=1 Tax=unclassified Streptomyces TaxID=2593676 RepID=UPI0033D9BBB7
MAQFALRLELGQGADLVGQGDLGADAVQLHEIDPLGPQLAQGSSTCCLRQAGRPTGTNTPGAGRVFPTVVVTTTPSG